MLELKMHLISSHMPLASGLGLRNAAVYEEFRRIHET